MIPERTLTRREVGIGIAGAVAGAIFGPPAWALVKPRNHSKDREIPNLKPPATAPDETIHIENPHMFILHEAEEFMKVEPGTVERSKKEVKMWQALQAGLEEKKVGPKDIFLALMASASAKGRGYGMELLWRLRQQGRLKEDGFPPLEDKFSQWAQENDIDERMLAFCIDAQKGVKKLLAVAPDLFFEATSEDARPKTPEEVALRVPNPGYLAKLLQYETGLINNDQPDAPSGFINVGTRRAKDQWNLSPGWFPYSPEALRQIIEHHKKNTGLSYDYNNIPGSVRGKGDGSGGAIGPQFMPQWGLLFIKWYDEANQRLPQKDQLPPPNLWDPYTGAILSYLYIASEFYHRQASLTPSKGVIKPGYFKGDEDKKYRATAKWNPLGFEIRNTLAAANDFYNNFPQDS